MSERRNRDGQRRRAAHDQNSRLSSHGSRPRPSELPPDPALSVGGACAGPAAGAGQNLPRRPATLRDARAPVALSGAAAALDEVRDQAALLSEVRVQVQRQGQDKAVPRWLATLRVARAPVAAAAALDEVRDQAAFLNEVRAQVQRQGQKKAVPQWLATLRDARAPVALQRAARLRGDGRRSPVSRSRTKLTRCFVVAARQRSSDASRPGPAALPALSSLGARPPLPRSRAGRGSAPPSASPVVASGRGRTRWTGRGWPTQGPA